MSRFAFSSPRCRAAAHPPGTTCNARECTFRVAWSINPHMVVGAVDPVAAVSQHAAYIDVLRTAGAELVELPFVHGAYDSVFAKDSAVLTATRRTRRALLATPRHAERRIEQAPRRAALESRGFEVYDSASHIEGGDVVVAHRALALLGHGFRSDPRAARALDRFLDAEVLPLRLVDPALYHLDTALAVLKDGTLVYCKEAFAPESQAVLEREFSARLEVSRPDALRFALNFVEVGNTIVTGTRSDLVRSFERAGKRVVVTPLDQFQRAGGSAACLVAEVHALDRTAFVDQRSTWNATAAMRSMAA